MKYEYVATNVIPVRNNEERDKYLDLCYRYFFRAGRSSLPEAFMERDIIERDNVGEKIYFDNNVELPKGAIAYPAKLKEDASLEDFSLYYTTNLGFLENIIYDAEEKCFKLRLFAEESLKERNLDIIYESMRNWLASGLEKLGLEVHKQIEESIEPITTPVSWDDIRYYHWNQIIGGIQINEGLANMELLDSELYECGAEERRMCLEDRDNAKSKLRMLNTEQRYFPDTNYMELLKSKADLFKEVRDEFILKFPELKEEFEGTAFGSFPCFPLTYLTDCPAMVAPTDSYLPVSDDSEMTLNFLNAEIIERPVSDDNCRHIMSFYPYTSPSEEINELHVEFLKDEEVMKSIIAHNFGEIVMDQQFPPFHYNFLDMLLNSAYRGQKQIGHIKQVKQRHKKIDELMVEMGYEKERDKFYQAYLEVAERAIKNNDILLPDYQKFLGIKTAYQERFGSPPRQTA